MQTSNFPPNLNPHEFTLLAVAIGFATVGDFDVNEQNSIGNFLIMVGQYVLTHAAQQQLIEGRIENNNINTNSRKAKHGGSIYTDESNKSNQNQRDEVEYLLKAVKIMEEELKKRT